MQFIVLLFFFITAHAQIRPADQQYIPQENLLLNPGLEQGRVNWTISGTATASLEQTANAVLTGLSSLKIVASSQTFNVEQFTTKSATSLNGMQAMASVRVKTNQSGVQVCSIENSVHVKCVSVDSTNQAKEYIIPFVFNSTNNGIVIKGASGTGTTYIDDAYVGIMSKNNTIRDNNLIVGTGVFLDVDFSADVGNLNNPKIRYNSTSSKWQYSNNGTLFEDFSTGGGGGWSFAGQAHFLPVSGCSWPRAAATNPLVGPFTATAACPGPTIVHGIIGTWLTTDSNLPKISIDSVPAGYVKVTAHISTAVNSFAGRASLNISDGTTTCRGTGTINVTTSTGHATVSCVFYYASAGNRSFEIYGGALGSAVLNIINDTSTITGAGTSGLIFLVDHQSI